LYKKHEAVSKIVLLILAAFSSKKKGVHVGTTRHQEIPLFQLFGECNWIPFSQQHILLERQLVNSYTTISII